MTPSTTGRTEHDMLGTVVVPGDVYYGVHTVRALANFPISGETLALRPHLVDALAAVKQAAATANMRVGALDDSVGRAIAGACAEIRSGRLHDQFVVDLIQGGAGTSTNMNANEVIANRACELLGRPRGDYATVHPLDDVNLGQSTNDVYPTTVKLALDAHVRELLAALARLRTAFQDKAVEFAEVLKMGRTQLQDAVPMTLGQELGAFAVTLGEDEARLSEARLLLHELNLGGTAIGTGLNTRPGYREAALDELRVLTGIPTLVSATDLVEATQDVGVFVQLSGVLKRTAVKVSKICNDLRLLSSGPQAGLGEIELPARQAGSSIMPGKVNPVVPETVNQIAFEIIGNDVTVTLAAEGGQLQLNPFEPIIARALSAGLAHLTAGLTVLVEHCVSGIRANRDHLAALVAGSTGLVTALSPALGYETACAIATEAHRAGRPALELVRERTSLTEDQLAALLRPDVLTGRRTMT
ncbi:aspartate ammonia-lyase (plasmid) [Pseudonocardia sp. EC080610-09]|uniref:aspartate ammonia-lyase n=1 Tax=unclassified Pseudonocardia TaxID=2619320 RepID=UPI000706E7B3|nr:MULTISPECIES: aspartate ammonia-lyase [unclassified Pseudonocardia]ALL79797.1 aspartate ammonia-lyase [Pseudonocardia sp. EC080610-09]ALL85716.1 aspartate ammonia-lyase [Pseudonocardia sp. EC080619-01]